MCEKDIVFHTMSSSPTAPSQNGSQASQHGWTDITSLIKTTAASMPLGRMIHSDKFNLFDVMSAIEIMDEKMDPNMIGDRVLSIDERINLNQIDFKVEPKMQLVQIMDRLLQAEFTWYYGKTLPQTVFTCLYVQSINHIENPTLKAYCRSVIYMVRDIVALMGKTQVRDEEEFTVNMFGFDVYSEDLEHIVQELKDEETRLKDLVQNETDAQEKEWLKALLTRMRFRRVYVQIHSNLSKNSVQQIQNSMALIKQAQEEFKKMVAQHAELKVDSDSSVTTPGFDPDITKRVSSPHPLKPIDMLTFEATSTDMQDYLFHLEFIVSGLKHKDNLLQLMEMFHTFSALAPSIVARSRMLNVYYHKDKICGLVELPDLVQKMLLSLPFLSPSQKRLIEEPHQFEDGEHWIHNVGVCCFFILHALCLNRGRLRRKLRTLVPEFSHVIQKAEQLDQMCLEMDGRGNSSEVLLVFTQFLFDKLLDIMELYLCLGFELELYDTIEYGYIFYYLESISTRRLKNYASIDEMNAITKKDKKRKEMATKRKHTIELYTTLHQGFSKFMLGIRVAGLYETPSSQPQQDATPFFIFGSEKLRYEHRFAPFTQTHIPQYLPYEMYAQQLDVDNLNESVRASFARQSLMQAQHAFGSVAEYCKILTTEHAPLLTKNETTFFENLTKIANMNVISCKLLQMLVGRNSKSVEFEFSIDPRYPVIKLK